VTAKGIHTAASALNDLFRGDYGMRIRFYADRGLGLDRGSAFVADIGKLATDFRSWSARRQGHETRRTPHNERQRTPAGRPSSRKAPAAGRRRRGEKQAERSGSATLGPQIEARWSAARWVAPG
jgi:hypothetical protein